MVFFLQSNESKISMDMVQKIDSLNETESNLQDISLECHKDLIRVLKRPRLLNDRFNDKEKEIIISKYDHHHQNNKLDQFYNLAKDLADIKTIELAIDLVWDFEIEEHKKNEYMAAVCLREQLKNKALQAWTFTKLQGKKYN